ncbi:Hypothetical predicted protein [Octopus vulgaris]|uniref:Uncharacterized protein n=1 Tax=Octopus vulgaris TaxID=6645 RepID=A0AA36B9A1_OCTVU|nr:Hypothetical predicted protein [Octopus vulgaris]
MLGFGHSNQSLVLILSIYVSEPLKSQGCNQTNTNCFMVRHKHTYMVSFYPVSIYQIYSQGNGQSLAIEEDNESSCCEVGLNPEITWLQNKHLNHTTKWLKMPCYLYGW